jgi:hypothetical protein
MPWLSLPLQPRPAAGNHIYDLTPLWLTVLRSHWKVNRTYAWSVSRAGDSSHDNACVQCLLCHVEFALCDECTQHALTFSFWLYFFSDVSSSGQSVCACTVSPPILSYCVVRRLPIRVAGWS